MPRAEARAGTVRFAGYASVFHHPDRGGDVVKPGAFNRSLASGATVPLLWQHRAGSVIGTLERIEEDRKGLRVIGSLNLSEAGSMAGKLLKERKVVGLSFGYRVRSAARLGGVRHLSDLDLIEVSIVSKPMQPRARIHAVLTD